MAVYLGVDLGGTNIKAAVVSNGCNIIAEASRPTNAKGRTAQQVCDDIVLCMQEALQTAGFGRQDVAGVGVGCPGVINNKNGTVVYSNNLGWKNFAMASYLKAKTGFDIALGNDANLAALGEVYAGCAKGAQSAVVITLGTGVGSGIVFGGTVWTGHTGGAAEIGHMVIAADGLPCTCGRSGCFEAYSSATGLIKMAKEGIRQNPGSIMAQIAAKEGKVSGRTAFEAEKQGDAAAAEVVKKYIHYLSIGLTNIINIFYPEVIGLSGGVSKEGENLLARLRQCTYTEVFGGMKESETKIVQCTLGYKAGLVGAAMLGRAETIV